MGLGITYENPNISTLAVEHDVEPPKNKIKLANHMRERALKTMMTMPVPAREPSIRWRDNSACLGQDPELFFPEKGHDIDAARRICFGCSVIDTCLISALRSGEEHGVAGGLNMRDRRSLNRKLKALEAVTSAA